MNKTLNAEKVVYWNPFHSQPCIDNRIAILTRSKQTMERFPEEAIT